MAFSAAVSDEALALHESSVVIDGVSFFCEGYTGHLAKAGVTALLITVPDIQDDEAGALRAIASYHQLVRNDPKLRLIERTEDILQTKDEGAVGIIIAFQNARPLNYNLAMVELFHRLGTRVVQLTYNDRNFAADGCDTEADAGLSREGRELIREMNRVGIVLDLSHVGEQSCLEAIEVSEKPPILSHSNPRSLANIPRNVTDEQIRQVASKGGVIGLTPHPPMNWKGGKQRPTFADFLDCIDYVVDLVGVDHVGIGSDSEATPGAYPREVRIRLGARFSKATGGYRQVFKDDPQAKHLDGFKSMADFPVITQGLLDRGYEPAAIKKILGGNFLRVFQSVWEQAPA